ncbi:MAG: ASCH domain-containing protein, partial [Candidatus Magasanikbacteria bacterium]|nr:ASCH domain-containing protein [Candidatus Magasanikbacteria bacterium]
MKKIKFTDKLTNLILSGKKTSTWRLFDDKNLSEGDEVILVNKQTLEDFASAVIEGVAEKKLGELDDKDWEGHERYE